MAHLPFFALGTGYLRPTGSCIGRTTVNYAFGVTFAFADTLGARARSRLFAPSSDRLVTVFVLLFTHDLRMMTWAWKGGGYQENGCQ